MNIRLCQMGLALVASLGGLGPAALGAEEAADSVKLPETTWQILQANRLSYGYSDNPLLSPYAPLRSVFAEAAAELLLLRSYAPAWELSFFFQGSQRRYLISGPLLRDETDWFTRAEGRWNLLPRLRVSLALTAFGESSVLDLSETEATRLVVPARLRGESAAASVRLNVSETVSLFLSSRPTRTDYLSISGDFAAVEDRLRVEWRPAPRLSTGLEWVELRREYANRPQYTAGGRPIAGTTLAFWQSRVEASVALNLGDRGRRSIALTAGRQRNQDRASGYFDYDQDRAGLRLDWSAGLWSATLEGLLRREVYPVQTGGTGIAPPPRRSQHVQGELRGERSISRRWSFLVAIGRDQASGNLAEFNYTANTTSAGLRFTF